MTREDLTHLAHRIVTAQVAMHDKPEVLAGIRLATVMMTNELCRRGRMDSRQFLRQCGIDRETTQKDLLDRYIETVEAARDRAMSIIGNGHKKT